MPTTVTCLLEHCKYGGVSNSRFIDSEKMYALCKNAFMKHVYIFLNG